MNERSCSNNNASAFNARVPITSNLNIIKWFQSSSLFVGGFLILEESETGALAELLMFVETNVSKTMRWVKPFNPSSPIDVFDGTLVCLMVDLRLFWNIDAHKRKQ